MSQAKLLSFGCIRLDNAMLVRLQSSAWHHWTLNAKSHLSVFNGGEFQHEIVTAATLQYTGLIAIHSVAA